MLWVNLQSYIGIKARNSQNSPVITVDLTGHYTASTTGLADSYSLPAIVCVTEMLSGAHSDSEFRNFTLEAWSCSPWKCPQNGYKRPPQKWQMPESSLGWLFCWGSRLRKWWGKCDSWGSDAQACLWCCVAKTEEHTCTSKTWDAIQQRLLMLWRSEVLHTWRL